MATTAEPLMDVPTETREMDHAELRAGLESLHIESFGWALACCRHDQDAAENALQSAYLKVLEGKARFDGRSSLKTWLFGVIRVTAAEERRRRWLHRLRLMSFDVDVVAPAQAPDEAAYRSQLAGQVRERLRRLPRRQQQVLQLVFYHGLTLGEAGAVLGISIGSTRRHYERGKTKLRQWLAAAGIP